MKPSQEQSLSSSEQVLPKSETAYANIEDRIVLDMVPGKT
jgi:hypothetical protein